MAHAKTVVFALLAAFLSVSVHAEPSAAGEANAATPNENAQENANTDKGKAPWKNGEAREKKGERMERQGERRDERGERMERQGDRREDRGERLQKQGEKMQDKADRMDERADRLDEAGKERAADKLDKRADKLERKGEHREERGERRGRGPMGAENRADEGGERQCGGEEEPGDRPRERRRVHHRWCSLRR